MGSWDLIPFEIGWRLYPENTPFFWESWTMPSTEKQHLPPWNCRRAWLPLLKGAVHILGEICPRSDPDIAHVEYCLDLNFPMLNLHRQVCKYGVMDPTLIAVTGGQGPSSVVQKAGHDELRLAGSCFVISDWVCFSWPSECIYKPLPGAPSSGLWIHSEGHEKQTH